MERIADLGDYVIYNGKFEYADCRTQILMKNNLTNNKRYKVTRIKYFPLFGTHYLLSPQDSDLQDSDSQCPYWYPFKSFTLDNRGYMKDKYNLR